MSSTAIIRTEHIGRLVPIFPPVQKPLLRRKESSVPGRNVLIIGSGAAARELAVYFQQHPDAGCAVRGFLDDHEAVGGEVLGRVDDLARVARSQFVDEIILTAPYERELAWRVIPEARRNHLSVKAIPDMTGLNPRAVSLDRWGDLPVLTLHAESVPALSLWLKRAADVLFSVTGLLVLAPILAVIAVAIRLDSAGPILYRARRAGKKGRIFLCHKFRTMVMNAEQRQDLLRMSNEREGPIFKMAHDPRVTRLGRFLRRYSLDELPQLWNVLRGEMSLVGPRPHTLDDFERYAPEHLHRLNVTPGITGLWQVTARREPSFQRGIALDMQYIEHWNLWLDLRILCRTLAVLVQGNGE